MTLEEIWTALQSYEGEGSKNFDLSGVRVQFYKGAMEIPLIAFHPSVPFDLSEGKLSELTDLLSGYGYELDCVEDSRNYKINRSEDGQYLGRLTRDAFKLHAARTKELGWETFSKMIAFHLGSALS